MLSKRFQNDGKPRLNLNELQQRMKSQIEEKIAKGIYSFEKVPCCICGGSNFELLSEKDRYGLYHPVVICRDCGLIQTNPRMTQSSYNQFYDIEYRRLYMGKDAPADEFFKSEYQHGGEIYDYLGRNLGGEPVNLFVVEVGCAAGGILQYFKGKANKVYGVDLDSEYVEFGRANYTLDIEIGTIDKVVKLDKSPDIVIYSSVLEHILSPVADLIKLRRRITQESYVYIDFPGVKNLTRSYFSYQLDFLRLLQNAHVYYPTLTSLKNILGKAGYDFVCGDEVIHSVFRKASLSECADFHYDDDYQNTVTFLHKLESAYKIEVYCNPFIKMASKVLKAVGLYNFASSLYHHIR